jgi:biopolymer transport protein ExbD
MQTSPLHFQGRRKLERTMDMTPLIDVVFQLLLFFMLTSALVVNQGMDLTLPEASQVKALPQEPLDIEISKSGILLISGKEIKEDMLEDYLRMTIADPEKAQAVIKSDSEVAVSSLVRVMDILKSSGIHTLSLAAQGMQNEKK